MRTLQSTNRFKRDLLRILKRGKSRGAITEVISILLEGKRLPAKNRDHKLAGNYHYCRECHIEPDWLLIYRLTDTRLILIRTGSHSDLFDE